MVTVTSVEAQNHFGKLLDTAQREPVTITRHGRVAGYLVSPKDMDVVTFDRRRREEAVATFQAWSESAKLTMLPAADELTDEDINRMVHEARNELELERSKADNL